MMEPAVTIRFDGPDGVGKSILRNEIVKFLEKRGCEVFVPETPHKLIVRNIVQKDRA